MKHWIYGLWAALSTMTATEGLVPAALTEDQFLDGIAETSPAVAALGGDLAAAESVRRRGALFANPRVEFEREHPDGNPRQDTWSVAWTPPFLDGRYGLARGAADRGVVTARQTLVLERLKAREDARKAFADWALADERSSLLASHVAIVDTLARHMSARAERGEESGLAAGRLRLAAAQARADGATASAERTRAEAAARTWRSDLADGVKLTRPSLSDVPAIDATETPELIALTAETEKASLEHRLSGRFWGAPEVQIGRQKIDQGAQSASGPVFGVSWSVPLFDRGQPERALAARQRDIAAARLEIAKRRITLQIAAAKAGYGALLDAAREVREETAAAPRLREAAAASFRAGEMGITDLLDTLRGVLDAQLRELEIYGATLDAQRSLELAAGRPLGGQR